MSRRLSTGLAALVVGVFLAAAPAWSQTTNFTFETSYSATGVDQWGSTTDGYANTATYQNFFGTTWNTSTNFGGFSYGLFGDKYGFQGTAYTNGKIGLDVYFQGTTGSLDVNLVNNVNLAVSNLSLASGPTGLVHVTQDRVTPAGGNVLTSVFPTMQMSVDATFQIDAGVTGEFAYGVGSSSGTVDLADVKDLVAITTLNPLLLLTNPFDTKLRIFSYNLNNSHDVTIGTSIGTIGGGSIGTGDIPVANLDSPTGLNLPLTAARFKPPTRIGNYDVSANTDVEFGSITIHDPNNLNLSSGSSLTATGSQAKILSLGVDPIGLATLAAGYPINPLDPKISIPDTPIEVEATLLKAQLNLDLGADQKISLSPNTYVRLLSNYAVTYLVNGQTVTTDDLRYLLPNDGSAADIQITGKPTESDWTLTPTVYVAPTVQNTLNLDFSTSLQVTAGALTVDLSGVPIPIVPALYSQNVPFGQLGAVTLLDRTLDLSNLAAFQGIYRSLRPLIGGAVPVNFSVALGENVIDDSISGTYKAQPIAGTLSLTNSVFNNTTRLDIPGAFNLNGASNIAGANGLTVTGTLNIAKGSQFIDSGEVDADGNGLGDSNGRPVAGFVNSNGLVDTGTFNIAGRLTYSGEDIQTIAAPVTFNITGDLADPTHHRVENNGVNAFEHLSVLNGTLSLTDESISTDQPLTNNGNLAVLGKGNFASAGYTSSSTAILSVGGGNTVDVRGGSFGNLDASGVLSNFSVALGDTTGATFLYSGSTGITSSPGMLILSGTRPAHGFLVNYTSTGDYDDALSALTSNSGTLLLANSATQSMSGSLSNSGTIGITMPASPAIPVAPFSSLSLSGTLTNSGSLIIDGGRFSATSITQPAAGVVQLTRGAEVDLSGSLGTGGAAPVGHWLLDGNVNYHGSAFTSVTSSSDIRVSGAGQGFHLADSSNAFSALASNAGTLAFLNGANSVTAAAFSNSGQFTVGASSGFTSNGLTSNSGNISVVYGGIFDTTGGFDSKWKTASSIPLTTAGQLTGGGTTNIAGLLYLSAPKRSDGGAPITGIAAGTTLAINHTADNILTDPNYGFGGALTVVIPGDPIYQTDILGNTSVVGQTAPQFYDGFQNLSTVAGTLALGAASASLTNASLSILSGGSLTVATDSTLMVAGPSFSIASGATVDFEGNLILGGGANTTSFAIPNNFAFVGNTQLGRVVTYTYTNSSNSTQTSYYVTTGKGALNSSGTWSNAGTITGVGTIHGQNITNTGAISAAGGNTGAGDALVFDNSGGTLTNSGNLVSGGNAYYTSRLTISNMNVVNSITSGDTTTNGQLYASSYFDLNHDTVTGGYVTITGTGRLSLLDTTLANVSLSADGAIDILNNTGGSSTIGGTILLKPSAILTVQGNGTTGATLNVTSGSTFTNTGRIYLQDGANFAGGTITNKSLIAVGGGRVGGLANIDNQVQGVITFDNGTNLQLNGTFSNAGRIELSDEAPNALASGVTVSHSQITLLGDTTLTGGGSLQLGGYNTVVSTATTNGNSTSIVSTQWRNGSVDLGDVTVTGPTGSVLTLSDQTITGQGQLGDGQLAIVNDVNGIIRVLGNGSTLTIDTYADPNTDPNSPVVDGFRNLGTLDIGVGAKLIVTGGAFHSFDNGVLSEGRYRFAGTLQIDGLASFDNASDLVFGSSTGRITNQNGDALAIRNNLATGSMEVRDGATYSFNTTSAIPFTNSGTLIAGPGGTLGITGGHFANYANHTLTGGTYSVAGTFKFDGADITTNAANLILRGGQIQDANGNDGLRNFSLNTGDLTVTDSSTYTLSSAVPVFHQHGLVEVDAGSTLDFGHTTVNNIAADAVNGILPAGISNYYVTGTIKSANEFDTNGAHVTLYSNTANLQVGSSLVPQSVGSGGTLTMAGGYSRTYGSSTPFQDAGVWEIGSPSTPTLAGGTQRSGASITFGSSIADGAVINGGGVTRFYGGATDDGTATNLTINNLTVNGTLDLNDTVNLGVSASLTVNGVLANTVSPLSIAVAPNPTPIPNHVYVQPPAPTITVNGGLNLRHIAALSLNYNYVSGSPIDLEGTAVNIQNGSSFYPIFTNTGAITLIDGATLTKPDAAGIGGKSSLFLTLEDNPGSIVLSNTQPYVAQADGQTFITRSLTGLTTSGGLVNEGTIAVNNYSSLTIGQSGNVVSGALTNYGTISSTNTTTLAADYPAYQVSAGSLVNYGTFSTSLIAGSVTNKSGGLLAGDISTGALVNEGGGTLSAGGSIYNLTNYGTVTNAVFTLRADANKNYGQILNMSGDLTLRNYSFSDDDGTFPAIYNGGTLHTGGNIHNDLYGSGDLRTDSGQTILSGNNLGFTGKVYVDNQAELLSDDAGLGGPTGNGVYGDVTVGSGSSLGVLGTIANHRIAVADGGTVFGADPTNPGVLDQGISSSGFLGLGGSLTVLGSADAQTLSISGPSVVVDSATAETLQGSGTLTIAGAGGFRFGDATLGGGGGIKVTNPQAAGSLYGTTLTTSIDSLGTVIYFDETGPVTYEGIISGTTGVDIRSGALTYDHQQSYGGVTTIEPGTSLTLADGALPVLGNGAFANSIGNVAGNILNNGTLIFDSSHDQTIGASSYYDANNLLHTAHYGVAGHGSITKLGSNTLTATDASFLNNLTISSGIFQAGDGTTAANGFYIVSNNGTLRLDTTGTAVLTLSGSGNFESYGSGNITLAMTGGTTVDNLGSGTLVLPGDHTETFTGKVRLGSFASALDAGQTIGGGALLISDDSSLGAVPSTFTSDSLTINGGTLSSAGSAVTLAATRGVTIGFLGATFASDSSLTIPTPLTASSGTTTLTKTGFGSLSLVLNPDSVAANPFAYHVSQGVLNLDDQGAVASVPNTMTSGNDSTVNFIGGGTTYVATDASSFLGRLNIASGTTLELNGGIAGSPTIGIDYLHDDGTLVSVSPGAIFQSIVGAGSYVAGASMATVGTLNLPTGSVTVRFGTLTAPSYFAADTILGTEGNATLNVTNGSTGSLTFDHSVSLAVGNSFNINGTVSGSGVITKTGDGSLEFNGGGTVANNIETSGGFFGGRNGTTFGGLIDGDSTFLLTGASITDSVRLTADDTYSGGTTVSVGDLILGNGGYKGSVPGDITVGIAGTDTGGVVFDRAGSLNIFQPLPYLYLTNHLTGPGHLTQAGPGTLIINTDQGYTGPTNITAGILQIGDGGTTGSLSLDIPADPLNGKGPIHVGSIVDHASLVLDRSDTLRLDNDITGTGTVTQIGTGTASLYGALSYTGLTTVSAGTLELASAFANVGGISVSSHATLLLSGTGDVTGNIDNSGVVTIDRSADSTLSFTTSGSGYVTKQGTGKVTLGDLHPGNQFSIAAGDLGYNIASGHAETSIQVAGGTGTFFKEGDGTLAVAGANSTFSGNIAVRNGTLQFGNGGATGLISPSTISISDVGTLAFDLSSDVFAGNISGAGKVHQMGSGLLTLSGNNTYTGLTIIDSGSTLQLDTPLSGNLTNNGTLRFSPQTPLTITSDSTGTGTIDVTRGSVTLSGQHTATGGATIDSGASLTLSPTASLAGNIDNEGNLTLETIFNSTGQHNSVPANLSGDGSFTVDGGGEVFLLGSPTYTGQTHLAGGSTLTLSPTGTSTLVNSISGVGNFKLDGLGTLVLWKASSIQGNVEVSQGTLQFGDGTLGDANNDHQGYLGGYSIDAQSNLVPTAFLLSNGGTVAFDLAVPNTISTPFTGIGGIRQMGPGAITLTGDNSGLEGTSTVDAGRFLYLGEGGSLGRGPVVVNGRLTDERTEAVTMVNDFSGSSAGYFEKDGTTALSLGSPTHPANVAFDGEFHTNGSLDTYTNGGSRLPIIYASTLTNHGTLTVNQLNVASVTNAFGGDLTLTGAYSSPVTNVGRLTLGNGGATGSIFHAIDNQNTLAFNHSNDVEIGIDHITGGGSIEQRGTGMLSVYTGTQTTDTYYIDAGVYRAYSGTLRFMQPVSAPVQSASGATVSIVAGTYDNAFVGISANTEGFSGVGKLVTTGDVNLTYAGNQYGALELGDGIVTLAGTPAVVDGQAGLSLALGPLSGTGTLDYSVDYSPSGSRVLTLNGDNTHTGSILAGDSAVLSAGSLASNLTFTTGGSLTFTNASGATFSGSYTGIDRIAAAGSGTLTLVTGVGQVDLTAGRLLLESSTGTVNATGGSVTLGGGGSVDRLTLGNDAATGFDLSGHDATLGYLSGGGAAGGNVEIGSQTLTVNQGIRQVPQPGVPGGYDNVSDDTTYAGAISGTGKLIKEGVASLELSGANTFSGGIDVQGGSLILNGTTNPAGGYLVDSGAALFAHDATNFGAAPASVRSDLITLAAGRLEALAPVTLSATQGITLNGGGQLAGALTVESDLAGTGTLTIDGGRVVLDGHAYGGLTDVRSGVLALGHLGAVDPTKVTFEGGSALDVNGHSLLTAQDWNAPLVLESATLANGGTTPATVSIPITVDSVFSLDGSGSRLTFTGQLVGTNPISLSASGDVVLGSPSAGRITSITVHSGNLAAPLDSLTALTDVTAGEGGTLHLTGSASSLPIVNGVRDLQLASVTLDYHDPVSGLVVSGGGISNDTDGVVRLTTNLQTATFPVDTDRALVGGSQDLILAGSITGATDLAKIGAGRLTIQSDTSGWSGIFHTPGIEVEQGTLAADSSFYHLRHLTVDTGGTAVLTDTGTLVLRSLTGAGVVDLGDSNLEFDQINTSLPGDGVFTGTVTTTGTITHNDPSGLTFGSTNGDKQSYGTVNAGALVINAGDVTVTDALHVGSVSVIDHFTTTTNGISSNNGTVFTGNIYSEGSLKFLGGEAITGNTGSLSLAGTQATLTDGNGAAVRFASNSGSLSATSGAHLSVAPIFTNHGDVYVAGRDGSFNPSYLDGVGVINQAAGSLTLGDTPLVAKRLNISGGSVAFINGSYFQNTGAANSDTAVTNPGILMTGGSLTVSNFIFGGLQINGGTFSTGSDIASVRISNGLVLGSAGHFVWKIDHVGTFDPGSGASSFVSGSDADALSISGSATKGRITVQSTPDAPFTIAIDSSASQVSDFVDSQDYAWTVATSSGITGFASNNFDVDDSKFAAHTGNFGVVATGNNLQVVYNWSYVYDNANDLTVSTAITPGVDSLAAGDPSVITRQFGGVTKMGAGTLTLSGDNTYTGTTKVTDGTLVVGSATALGTGDVVVSGTGRLSIPQGTTVANKVTLAGGTLARTYTGDLTHALDSSSDLGSVDTSASILGGTSAAPTTIVTSFAKNQGAYIPGSEETGPGHFAAGSDRVLSDIYTLSGTGTAPFVLQLSFASISAPLYLGWLDPSTNQWVNAVEGNTMFTATYGQQGYSGTYASFESLYGNDPANYVGAWGTYTQDGISAAWAVLNHNSTFALTTVPEPGAWGAIMGAALFGLALRRRRRL